MLALLSLVHSIFDEAWGACAKNLINLAIESDFNVVHSIASVFINIIFESFALWTAPPYFPELVILSGLFFQFHPCLSTYKHSFHKGVIFLKLAMTVYTVGNVLF
jgi:hypothetical protein